MGPQCKVALILVLYIPIHFFIMRFQLKCNTSHKTKDDRSLLIVAFSLSYVVALAPSYYTLTRFALLTSLT
jgi:hypothetical protein